MGVQGHIIKIGVTVDDHGGKREEDDKQTLEFLYAEIYFLINNPRFERLSPTFFSDHKEV